ncbi:MAG: tetratricopeptide repeat protein [Novosphingobium sp.]|nr:tetratricopeptide repeat protein [Novosphingobium sp.]
MALRPKGSQSRSDQLAARNAAQQDVFMREVDEALRQDEMLDAVKRYGKPVASAVIVALLALGAFLWWQHSKAEAEGDRSLKFATALDTLEAGHVDAAASDLAPLAGSGGNGSQAAAQLLRADILLGKDKPADATRLYEQVAAGSDVPQPYRNLATIRAVAAQFDALPPATVVARLKPLAEPGNPWFASAGELVGMAYLRQGRNDLAGPLFGAIAKDKDSPASVRARARQMAGFLGVDTIDDVARAAGVGAPAPLGATP